ncbi:MAG: class I SAM-dependent methyltransferase, partial [Planctomycetota bacterium]
HTTSKKINKYYFKGKTVLEVGCGHGKYVKILNDLGCENIGLDLGTSVDLVYEITKDRPTAHVIQGNAMEPPLKEETFDYVWSHGVLHHTPSTKDAVNVCSKLPKKHTGWFYVWVYHKGGFIWEHGNRLVRSITTRLPEKAVILLSYALAPLLYIIPAYNKDVNLSHVSWSECALSINDWLAPKYQWHHSAEEVISWYEELGYKDIEVTPANGVGIIGMRK